MKAEDSREADAGADEVVRNTATAAPSAEAEPTTRQRTKAESKQEGGLMEVVCERGNLISAVIARRRAPWQSMAMHHDCHWRHPQS